MLRVKKNNHRSNTQCKRKCDNEGHKVRFHRKILKPSTPTPKTFRHLKLGFIDEYAPFINVSTVLFYSVSSDNNPEFVIQLEISLEKILTQFKPIAGRYVKDTHTVDCNDQGAEFIQASVNIKLQDLLDNEANTKFVDEFKPCKYGAADQDTDPILSIQVTTFECGSVALGVGFSHKIGDASTECTFLTEWAAMSKKGSAYKYNGSGFNSFSLFPATGLPSLNLGKVSLISDDDVTSNKIITLKLSFKDNMIYNLQQKASSTSYQRWSKVQFISALIAKGLTTVDRAIHGHARDCIVLQPINLREKTASLIPRDSCGNLWGMIVTDCKTAETTKELANLLSDSVKKTVNNYSNVHHDTKEGQGMVLNSLTQVANITNMANVIIVTSWCKFPFYKVDFGFGKPVLVSGGSLPAKNVAYMLDGVGSNGVEAYVSLEAKHVSHFEKAFAS